MKNLQAEAELEYLRGDAKRAIATQVKNSEYYYKRGIEDADAAENAKGAEREKLIANATRNNETSERIAKDTEALTSYINYLEEFIKQSEKHAEEYAAERFAEGYKAAQRAQVERPKQREQERDRQNIARHNAEIYGGSTEGQWGQPMRLMKDGTIQPLRKQKVNYSQLQ
jgi:predicted ribosome quality control (RQC) complex YloA/Tae2 family protein